MKVGDIVNTPDGKGEIKYFEDYSRINDRRVCVELVNNSYSFSIVCYFEKEINGN